MAAAARLEPPPVDLDYEPQSQADLMRCLADPYWRVCSGYLYKIMVKTPDGAGGEIATTVPFRPNAAQREVINGLWHRNVILKARQLGMTTLTCILWLDHALFVPDQRCGIVAHTRPDAELIFRDKVKFAYDNLPPALREMVPLKTCTVDEIVFAHNNSSVRVAVSMRSGTIHRLLVSELGKLGRAYPRKAAEVITGTLQAVPRDAVAIIESTAEGQDGEFYRVNQTAMQIAQRKKPHELAPTDWRFFFFPWWSDPDYVADPASVVMTPADTVYFAEVEQRTKTRLSPEQRAWYVAKRQVEFSGDAQKMWQEYPSYAAEAFKVSAEGAYFAAELAAARVARRITQIPYLPSLPVNTFWDIGQRDGTAIWLHQHRAPEHRFCGFMENWGEGYQHYVQRLQATGYVFGTHFLPHDAGHRRQIGATIMSPLEMLQSLWPGQRFEIVPAPAELRDGIQAVRQIFPECWFDEAACDPGLAHLLGYRKRWNQTTGAWTEEPLKNEHTEAADAFRQFAQAAITGARFSGAGPTQIVRKHRLAR